MRVSWRLVGGLALALGFVALGLAAWQAVKRMPPEQLAELDILSMLREIERTNRDVQAVNEDLLTALTGVEEQVGGVERVHERLKRLEGLLEEQTLALDRLHDLTASQAVLSQELHSLTGEALPAMTGLAKTARDEAVLVAGMGQRTQHLAGQLRGIRDLNYRMAAKLKQADSLADRILRLLLP